MSDDSDDEFTLVAPTSRGGAKEKGKGKAKPAAQPQANKFDCFSLDSLLAQSEMEVERGKKIAVGLDMSEVDRIISKDFDIERDKRQVYEENARAEREEAQMLSDESISIPGTIEVFVGPKGRKPRDLVFDAASPSDHSALLFEALKRSATDPADLEELLRGALVPWVRQKLEGRAPPEVCRWLLLLQAWGVDPCLVLAAEDALLQLVAQPKNVWKLRYEDSLEVWRSCGAVWLRAAATGAGPMKPGGVADGEDDEGRREQEGEEDGPVLRNLGSFLTVVEACLRRGAHEMDEDRLRSLLLDLLAAALDEQVCGSCQTEVYRAIQAVVDAMPREVFQDKKACSSLVDQICDPRARGLASRMGTLSAVLLARNVPLRRGSASNGSSNSSISRSGELSLRHEVSHRLLRDSYLKGTSYVTEEVERSGRFGRGLKAMEVLLDDEDDIMEDDSLAGYERQLGVVALVNEMCAGSLAASDTGLPDPQECREMLSLLGAMDKQLRNVMQRPVQMCKTLLDLMRSKLKPFAKERARQWRLSDFTDGGGGGGSVEDEDEEDEKDDDDDGGDRALGAESEIDGSRGDGEDGHDRNDEGRDDDDDDDEDFEITSQ